MGQTARHVVFRGRVQGVGFRYTSRQIASHYAVTGFVRNCPDGTVEMFIQGEPDEIDNCIADIQSEFAGHVRDTQIEPAAFSPRYTDFRIVL
ncbi:MAG TPA: acylphosphatase [Sedimentisphaerales bacterium]|nr:acylphosphatase [Sedimentisphaerales bacterium]